MRGLYTRMLLTGLFTTGKKGGGEGEEGKGDRGGGGGPEVGAINDISGSLVSNAR